jgi:cell division septal protein FtsQ
MARTKQGRRPGAQARRPTAQGRRRRSGNRWARVGLWAAVVLGYIAIMWFVIFPWIDHTFINRPAL